MKWADITIKRDEARRELRDAINCGCSDGGAVGCKNVGYEQPSRCMCPCHYERRLMSFATWLEKRSVS